MTAHLLLLLPLLLPGPAIVAGTGAGRPLEPPAAVPQDPEADPQAQAVALMKRVRDRRTEPADRLDAAERLLDLGAVGAVPLARHLERDLKERRKRSAKAQDQLLRAFARAAQEVLGRRLDRETLARVEADRALVLGHARDPNLSKATVLAESDPALERLERTFDLHPNQVWEAQEALFADSLELRDALDEERLLGLVMGDALEVLRAAGELSLVERLEIPADGSGLEDELDRALTEACAAAAPFPERDRQVLERNRALAEHVDEHELAGIARLNHVRLVLGLNALELDPKLCDACRDHSEDMRTQGFFSHDSPVPGKETPWKRAANFGTSASAENIAAGARNGPAAILQWWHSPGHHRNMLAPAVRTGLGRSGSHWTQLFGR